MLGSLRESTQLSQAEFLLKEGRKHIFHTVLKEHNTLLWWVAFWHLGRRVQTPSWTEQGYPHIISNWVRPSVSSTGRKSRWISLDLGSEDKPADLSSMLSQTNPTTLWDHLPYIPSITPYSSLLQSTSTLSFTDPLLSPTEKYWPSILRTLTINTQ